MQVLKTLIFHDSSLSTQSWKNYKSNDCNGFSLVVNAHKEGSYLAAAIRSAIEAAKPLIDSQIPVEIILLLDNPDKITTSVAKKVLKECQFPKRTIRVNYKDLALSRNKAIRAAKFPWIAFLDGDDLWASNWLAVVHEAIQKSSNPLMEIFHPKYSFYFEQLHEVLHSPDQNQLKFPEALLIANNYWTALCCAHKTIFLNHPYKPNRLEKGWGFEDWSWNKRTIKAGYFHRSLPNSCHFIRYRGGSLGRLSVEANALPTP